MSLIADLLSSPQKFAVVGRDVPILLVRSFTGVLKGLRSFGKWSDWFEKASGVIILLVVFNFLWIT
jgi:cytochrome c biogenesis protein CcdA